LLLLLLLWPTQSTLERRWNAAEDPSCRAATLRRQVDLQTDRGHGRSHSMDSPVRKHS